MKEWTNSRCLNVMITRKEHSFPVSMAISSLPLGVLLEDERLYLHPEEQCTLTGDAQYHYLSGRHAAKLAAYYFTQTDPAAMRIKPGVFGQPVLYCPGQGNLQVSIAHSGFRAIAIVFPEWHPMAVDMEVTGAATEEELLQWTAREALSKVLKTGLTTDLELFRIQDVTKEGDFFISTFAHFIQYKAISWIAGNMVCSLVLPERSRIDTAALKALTSPDF